MALLQISEPGQSPAPHQFKRAVGIDLGTTNSLVATVKSGSDARVIADEQGSALVPSVVRYTLNGPVVGTSALESMAADPYNTLASFKRWMGRSSADIQSDKSYHFIEPVNQEAAQVISVATVAGEITPVQASAEVLRLLAERAESALGGALHGAVITVPAYFDDAQRQATKDAAGLAGVNVLRLINEPTAAAVAYGLDKADDRYIVVYDLGGGTFDVSILQLSEGVFEVLATGGDTALGGDDFDHAIANWVLQNADRKQQDLSAQAYRQLLMDCRAAKQHLTDEQAVGLSLQADSENHQQKWAGELSRDTFEQLVAPLIEKTLRACEACLHDANLDANEIGDVVMVGGSTRVPAVQKSVEALFSQQPKTDVNPDEVVAIGAAIQADMLAGNQRSSDLILLDVIPLSLGIETMGGLVEKIIPRNTAIPSTRAQEFTTYKEGQTALAVHVLQGERERADDCRSLARFELRGIPAMAAGAARIKVTFHVDADGLLSVSAEEVETGVEASVQVKPSYGLGEEQITEMIKASYTFAQDDRDARMLAEQKVDGEALYEAVKLALQKDRDLLDEQEYVEIQTAMDALELQLQQDNIEKIKSAIRNLGSLTESFAERRMNQSIKLALQGKALDEFSE